MLVLAISAAVEPVAWADTVEKDEGRLSPPTRNGLLNASMREVTLVAPRPLTLERTLDDCSEMLAID
jgi:hypothetical protein